MIYFLDTEFAERRGSIQLISIGIVCEDGREFYAESSDFTLHQCNQWVRENVLPKLGPLEQRLTDDEIAARVREFVTHKAPNFWGYYADYDWVVFCWLFGAMVDLPKGWPMYCRDLKQLSDSLAAPKFDALKGEHNALEDARWNRMLHQHLTKHTDVL